ncbi:MAG: N-acetylmuramoyl-L-alanine amidase [Roseivivax sp.]|nr:N-acetylmuramoyl-L-alanine amidase [Roseivivax sp.]
MSRIIKAGLALLWLCAAAPLAAQDRGVLARVQAEKSGIEDTWNGNAVLRLALSQGVPYRVFTLTAPNRLVLDFRQVDWQGAEPAALDRSDAVEGLRFGTVRPGWSRLVALLAAPMAVKTAGLAVDPAGGAALLDVVLTPVDQSAFDAAAGAPPDPAWAEPAIPEAAPAVPRAPDGPLVVVIDPGHGGIDPGAQNGEVREAVLMLAMARELRETLLRAGGYDVFLTREDDGFVSLEARVALAHERRADLFISLHADALEAGRASGSAVYTLAAEASDAASAALAERHNRDDLLSGLDLSGADDRVAGVLMDLARLDNAPRSQALARHLVDGIRNATGRVHKHPLRQAGFSVLKSADIPSVLVEVGFLSTAADLDKLRDPLWRATMAAGIRDGIAAWALEDAALANLRRH